MTYSDTIKLAHELGGKYELGYWKFPTEEAKATYRRRVSGLEWTPAQRAAMDTIVVAKQGPNPGAGALTPDLPDGAVMEDLQGNFYNAQGEKLNG